MASTTSKTCVRTRESTWTTSRGDASAALTGGQAAVGTLNQLRGIGHALRAWPTPLGVAINSADQIWDEAGELIDVTVTNQLNLLASQVLTFVRSTPGQAAG